MDIGHHRATLKTVPLLVCVLQQDKENNMCIIGYADDPFTKTKQNQHSKTTRLNGFGKNKHPRTAPIENYISKRHRAQNAFPQSL